jgi:hypothetical protein
VPITVNVSPATVPGSVSGGATICLGNSTGPLNLAGNNGSILGWEVSTDGGATWTSIANTTSSYSTLINTGGTYWYRAIVQSGVCPSQGSAYTVVNVPVMSAISPTTGVNGMCNIMSPNNWVYILDPVNKLITSVFDATGGNNLMNTTAYLTIDPTVQVHPYTGEPYLQRHFQITPVSSGLAEVKLYFTQAELNALMVAAPYITSINDLAVTKFDDAGVWANAVYYPNPIPLANDPWPGVHSLRITVTGFSKFYIHGKQGGGPLPVEFLSFDGSCNEHTVTLNWSTASETNNQFFRIERSSNSENWVEIGTVPGAGNSNQVLSYFFTDPEPLSGTGFYRLAQVDQDGSTHFSNILAVQCSDQLALSGVAVYPNPSHDFVNVRMSGLSGEVEILLYDMMGQVVHSEKVNMRSDQTRITLLDMSAMRPGVYHLEVVNGEAHSHFELIRNQ